MDEYRGQYVFTELVLRALQGDITSQQMEQLDDLLKTNPQLIRAYVILMDMYVDMSPAGSVDISSKQVDNIATYESLFSELAREERTAPRIEVPRVEPPRELIQKVVYPQLEKREVSKFGKFVLITTAAAALFIFAFVKIEPLLRPARIEVATLADQAGAQWAHLDSGQTLHAGDRLRSHEEPFWLQKGTARIRFDYGAEVIVEGPAEFELVDAEKMVMNSGRLYVTIPEGAAGFTTVTPSATIIDLGTEFGVKVDVDGSSDVHMFKGKASLVSGQAGKKNTGISLLAGNAKRVDTQGRVTNIDLNKDAFVRPAQYEWMSMADKGSAYHRWLLYSYKLRKDPSLVAYYTFDNEAESSGMLLNRALATAGKLNGTLGDGNPERVPTWAVGRWPQKGCLRFDNDLWQHIVIEHDDALSPGEQLSLCFWIYLEDEKSGGHLLSKRIPASDIEYQAAMFGDIGNPSRDYKLQFGAGIYPSEGDVMESLNYTDPVVRQLGQWRHVVTTFGSGAITYYLDGKVVATVPHSGTMIRCTEPLLIGTDYPGGDPYGFDGLMGELAIFKRVLPAGEVWQMYQAGKPQ